MNKRPDILRMRPDGPLLQQGVDAFRQLLISNIASSCKGYVIDLQAQKLSAESLYLILSFQKSAEALGRSVGLLLSKEEKENFTAFHAQEAFVIGETEDEVLEKL